MTEKFILMYLKRFLLCFVIVLFLSVVWTARSCAAWYFRHFLTVKYSCVPFVAKGIPDFTKNYITNTELTKFWNGFAWNFSTIPTEVKSSESTLYFTKYVLFDIKWPNVLSEFSPVFSVNIQQDMMVLFTFEVNLLSSPWRLELIISFSQLNQGFYSFFL